MNVFVKDSHYPADGSVWWSVDCPHCGEEHVHLASHCSADRIGDCGGSYFLVSLRDQNASLAAEHAQLVAAIRRYNPEHPVLQREHLMP